MIDARGYACPMPVIMTQRAVKADAPAFLEVLVDNRCALENVSRFAESQGYAVSTEPQGGDFLLRLSK